MVPIVLISMLYNNSWLDICIRTLTITFVKLFIGVLDFDLQLHPGAPTLGSGLMV